MDAILSKKHVWHFFRTGGLDQVLIRSGADIEGLTSLDQKLWTALSCPTKGIRFDAKTLAFLDSDTSGRIRAQALLDAVAWLSVRLSSLDPLFEGSETVQLSSLNSATPEGKALLACAKRILANLGKSGADAITLADVTDTAKIFAATFFNGDGIVPQEAAENPSIRQAIADIITLYGSVTDRSGKLGVNQTKVDAFFAAASAYLDWFDQAVAVPSILPLGDKTAAAAAALDAVSAKIDDYFTRCRMADFDPRAAQALRRTEADLAALADMDLNDSLPAIAAFPLATVAAGRDLALCSGINPFWSEAIAHFQLVTVAPLLGSDSRSLSAEQWQTIKTVFSAFRAWSADKKGAEVAALGTDRLRALISDNVHASITALIEKDRALEAENAQFTEVEKLIRYHANLVSLLGNYVNMGGLYDPKHMAIFQVGTLYMDARACHLCFHVDNMVAHASLAAASRCCLAYCVLTRPNTRETRTICAAFTAGFAHTLWVGRNGVFYDPDGKDWDATIVKLVDNAISIREAFFDPWRKIASMISSQVSKLLAARQTAALTNASLKITAASAVPAPAEVPKKMEGAALASSVAALGIAIGLIGSAMGGLISVISGIPLWKTALGLVAVILIVSGPAMILGWFRLRARDIAPILNACGWAVNRPLHFSLKLGRLFTSEAILPADSVRQLKDPYADDNSVLSMMITLLIIAAAIIGLWFTGIFDQALPGCMKRYVPACTAAASENHTPLSAPPTP